MEKMEKAKRNSWLKEHGPDDILERLNIQIEELDKEAKNKNMLIKENQVEDFDDGKETSYTTVELVHSVAKKVIDKIFSDSPNYSTSHSNNDSKTDI